MSNYEQPPMGGYPYGASHLPPQPPPPHHAPPHPHHQHPQYPPQQYHHQQQPQQPQQPPPPHSHAQPTAHQPQNLPPMPQYASHVPPPQVPQQMPPPDMASNGPPQPPQAQMAQEPQRSIEPISRRDDAGRTYRLDVVQQPKRARMCGFGDKDRRPITPPPCVRLIILDPDTGKEADCNDIEHSMYVLNVDLWSEDGQREVNLVRHTNSAPSISSTTPCSYTGIAEGATPYQHILPSNNASRDAQYPPQSPMGYAPPQPQSQYSGYAPVPPGYPVQQYGQPNGYAPAPGYPNFNGGVPSSDYPRSEFGTAHFHARNAIGGAGAPQGMFTRNLIGSLAASAFKLSDPSDHIGIWFILQDLSVRTEGTFRLRFSFVNVGPPQRVPEGKANAGSVSRAARAPILACCYSDPFTVFSAKKFPGVCESTPLSKCFAAQGIKIPIRKEGQDNKRSKDDDDDDY